MIKNKLPVRFTGQHFTIDKVLIADAIKIAKINETDTVLDIGAGKGSNRQQKSRCSSGIFVEDSRRIIRGPCDRNISDDGCFFFDRMRNGSRLQREILRLSN